MNVGRDTFPDLGIDTLPGKHVTFSRKAYMLLVLHKFVENSTTPQQAGISSRRHYRSLMLMTSIVERAYLETRRILRI